MSCGSVPSKVQLTLSVLSHKMSALIIANRLSTTTGVVLREARVAESGTHNGSLASNGRYTSMWQNNFFNHEENNERSQVAQMECGSERYGDILKQLQSVMGAASFRAQ